MEEDLAQGERNTVNNIVFTRDDGTPLRLAYLNEKQNILIKRHSIHPITIPGLRHTHASLNIGVPLSFLDFFDTCT